MIILNQLAMSHGNKLLFNDVNLKLTGNKRYALVGANGTGKSTLLRLITGEETSTLGSVATPKGASIGWLKQDQFRYENTKIIDVVMQGKPKLWKALSEKEELLKCETWDEAAGYKLGHIEETIAALHGYTATSLAEKILVGLGIENEQHQQPLKSLSGGYKLRVLMAQTLFKEPDILLLDEPTNHLDILSIAWLEKYLKAEFNGILLFITHDFEFINRLADVILDIDYGEIRPYSGNYDKYLEEKKIIAEQMLQTKKNLEDKIANMQKFVDKFKAKASKARQAASKAKMIDRIELPDIKKSSRIAPNFHFKPKRQSGKMAVEIKHVDKMFDDKIIFENINLEIKRGEKIAVIGANGAGKSTLIKSLLGQVEIDGGEIEWGYETHISYFSQDHHDSLNKHINVFDWLCGEISNHTSSHIRKILGNVLFTKDEVEKDILSLSGGESARLLLARMMLEDGNVLILDEPTNHLDLDSIEALANALAHFSGTQIIVSHNRHFLSKVADRILYLPGDHSIVDFAGNYEAFEKKFEI